MFTACGTAEQGPLASFVPSSPTPTAAPSPTPTAQNIFHVGDKVQTAHGNFEQVFQIIRPYTQTGTFTFPADAGNEFAVADVELCAGPKGAGISANPYDYQLQMSDNSRVNATVPVKDPALNATTLTGPGDCVRGWVSFQVLVGVAIDYFVDTQTTPIIKWAP